jgi:hypothetical protein
MDNYPNPFSRSTTIPFELSRPMHVKLTVLDIVGRTVAELLDGKLSSGRHQVSWHTQGVATGLYFYRLEAEREFQTGAMVHGQ